MIELTKDNVVITSDGDIFIPVIGFRDIKSRLPKGKKLKQQIIDDYERARKFEQIKERVEKIGNVPFVWSDIQKLLEDSKK